ncbi:MAG: hypothetical protein Fur003_4320 [Candidatus Dojkabacteria bacterium]
MVFGRIISNPAGQQPQNTNNSNQNSNPETYGRKYKLGISGYSPVNFPNSSTEEATKYWQSINAYSQIYGIHTEWQDTKFVELANAMYQHDLSIVLGYQASEEWGSSTDELIDVVKSLLKAHPEIKYLAIGNEVNLFYEKEPAKFELFVKDYKEVYKEIKKAYPNVKVYTTFNYESLIGKGSLFGADVSHKSQLALLNQFKGSIDLIGITTYPYFDYKTPSEIPADYFAALKDFSDKPIVITETGWLSRETYGTKYSAISEMGLAGSQKEQSEYVEWLNSAAQKNKIEFINWIYLNDIVAWEEGTDPEKYVLFDSIGLHTHSGASKMSWEKWKSYFKK